MSGPAPKPLFRCIGEFCGHVWRGVRSDPSRREVRRATQEKREGDVIYRRTTIDEIEYSPDRPPTAPTVSPRNDPPK